MSQGDADFNNTFNQFNDLINQASNTAGCDAECQQQNQLKILEQKYKNSKINLVTAPEHVDMSFKNLYEFQNGELAYDEKEDEILKKRAQDILQKFKTNFKSNIENIKSLLGIYESLLKNYNNVQDYSTSLKKENAILEKKFKETGESIVTNDRKTYYEDQGIDQLNFYYSIFFYMYLLIVIVYAGSIFVFPSNGSKMGKLIILLVLIVYPFISTMLFMGLTKIYNHIKSILPKNAYRTL
jgi:archaellum biogenesis protein FlaJ (TadC family)